MWWGERDEARVSDRIGRLLGRLNEDKRWKKRSQSPEMEIHIECESPTSLTISSSHACDGREE